MRVGLLDEQGQTIPGRSVEDCLPVVGDSVSMQVKWKNGSDVSFREKQHTRLQVEMAAAELYGFQFVPVGSDVPEIE